MRAYRIAEALTLWIERRVLIGTLFVLSALSAHSMLWGQHNSSQRAAWNKPFAPFRIIGNIYYVGANGVSSFLITTAEGDILLDSGLLETASQIERNVEALGFHMRDVKYLLNSHAHYDHCGGLAELKRASGALMAASGGDAETLMTGHQLSYGPGQSESRFPAVRVDRILSNGDLVTLGGVSLTAHLMPGHTKGCTTWSMPVAENGRVYQVVFYCSTTVAGNQLVNNLKYPNIVSDYEHSFRVARSMHADVFLAAHPEFFDMQRKFKARRGKGENPFVDSTALPRFVQQSEADFREELKRQLSSAPTTP